MSICRPEGNAGVDSTGTQLFDSADIKLHVTCTFTGFVLLIWSGTQLTAVYYLLTPWSRVLLEKLTGSAASQEIPRIFGT